LFNDINPGIDFKIVTCKRYYSGFSKKVPEIQTGTLENICSKKILLIDDVEDEGITIKSVKEKLLELGASQVKAGVLYSRSNKSNADFIGVKGKGFAIFPWNRFQEILEFLKFELVHSSPKEKLKVLTKMGFLRSEIIYCMKRLAKCF